MTEARCSATRSSTTISRPSSPSPEAVHATSKIVYTPLHGVGGATVATALKQAGFPEPHVAAAQAEPDPDFPTVAFPNPEEPGAMDLAMALAEEVDADIVVANDPDADRCAVAVPGPHGWQMLRGDEVGALLGQHLLSLRREGVYATSIVSSSLLGKMAVAEKQLYAETLTGFKWIGRVEHLAFGYEEALGYCVDPAHVKDKDGVSALMMVCDIAARAKATGRTLRDLLDDLATQVRAARHRPALGADGRPRSDPAVVDRLRDQPPTSLGGLAVEQVDDLSLGSEHVPPTVGLRFRLADDGRVVVRPSGTEPKIKCYLEVVVRVEDEEDGVDAARINAVGRLDAIRGDLQAAGRALRSSSPWAPAGDCCHAGPRG